MHLGCQAHTKGTLRRREAEKRHREKRNEEGGTKKRDEEEGWRGEAKKRTGA